MAYIISADEIKKTLPAYDPSKSEMFHTASAKLADKAYERALKECPEDTVILMSGGAASGKSEYVSEYLQNLDAIVFDGTLPTYSGAETKISKALKSNKRVVVHAIFPANFRVAYVVFLNRERKFDESHFYRTHSESRKTLLEIAKQYGNVEIKIVHSRYIVMVEGGAMEFKETQFKNNRSGLIEYLEQAQYNESQIKDKIIHDN